MTIHYRLLTPADQSVCWEMLMHAAHETNLEAVQSLPELRGYAENWGRDGDRGYGAFDDQKVVGAAWVRLWSTEHPGYGFVAEDIPELAIAVIPDCRNQGVGTQLMKILMADLKQDVAGMSLSVRANNPVARLYERLGFVTVPGSVVQNRTGSESYTMLINWSD